MRKLLLVFILPAVALLASFLSTPEYRDVEIDERQLAYKVYLNLKDTHVKWQFYLWCKCYDAGLPFHAMRAIAMAESSWNRYTVEVSPRGNRISFGYFQVSKETASDYRRATGDQVPAGWSEERYTADPQRNIDIIVWAFCRSLKRSGGDWRRALMDHNLGPRAASEYLREHGHYFTPYNDLDNKKSIHREILGIEKVIPKY